MAVDVLIAGIMTGVASFTVTYLLRYTLGPFDIFEKFRRLVRLEIPVLLHQDGYEVVEWAEDDDPDTFFAKLVACFWCFTTWISLLVTLLSYVVFALNNLYAFPLVWLFAIGVSGILHELCR